MTDTGKIAVNLQDLRKPYHNDAEPYLLEKNMADDPIVQFDRWFKNLASYSVNYTEINAVALSTVSENRPSSRMVLLKEYGSNGFVFYTNSVSRKANDFLRNPYAAMLFYWSIVDRQVRVEGKIERLDPRLADDYWATRPIPSRIGSKLSPQSSVIPDRNFLESRRTKLVKLLEEKGEAAITRPETWLGYVLRPDYFEFWQGQSDRIHDRLVYQMDQSNGESNIMRWNLRRLAP